MPPAAPSTARNGPLTFNGVLSDVGPLNFTGTGSISSSAINTYTGATNVNGGTLVVNGSIASSSLTTVNTGGTLAGIGTVGNTLVAGGTFAPGSGSAGSSMTVSGSLVFQSAATYLVQVDPTISSASVTTTATLGGATVNAVFAPGTYVAKQYTILTATGGVNGTFSAVTNTNLPGGFPDQRRATDANHAFLNLALASQFPTGLDANQHERRQRPDQFIQCRRRHSHGVRRADAALA